MHLVLKQLEDSGAPAWLLFNDFNLAFSTPQLHLLIQKLKQLQFLSYKMVSVIFSKQNSTVQQIH